MTIDEILETLEWLDGTFPREALEQEKRED